MTYSAEILADSPVGYWRLGDPSGTTATDSSGNSHPGTYTSGPTLAQAGAVYGDADTSVSFDGTDDYIDLGSPTALRLTAAFTLEAWCFVPSGETQEAPLITHVFGSGSVNYQLGFFDGSATSLKPSVGFYNGGWNIANSATAISTNVWHHLVGTWDGTILRIYVDGTEMDTTTPGGSPTTDTNAFRIGSRWDATSPHKFKGRIDEVAIYGSALSAARILTHFKTAFSPASFGGLKIWLKADAGAGSSDGDLISSWGDQSGGSHNFTTSGSQRPTYRPGVRNGLPVVRFLTDDELSGGNLSALFSTGASMFAAANWISASTTDHMTLYESGQNDSWWSFSGAGYWGPFRSSRLDNTPSSGLPTSGWHMWSLTADNGSNYKVWLDSVNKINDTGGFTFAGGTQHWLARQHPSDVFITMDMGELIVIDSALNDTDRGNLETYVYDRWIATPAAPAVVAGVGSVPAATAMGAATALPGVVAGIGAVPAPTVFSIAGGTATPAVVVGTGAVPAPTAKGNGNGVPSAVVGVGAVPAATSKGTAAASPARVVGVGAVPAPTAFGVANGLGLPATVTAIGAVPFPTTEGEGTGGGGGSVDGANDFWSIVLAS